MKVPLALSCAGMVLAVAAAAESADPAHACALVSKAEMQAILGEPLAEPEKRASAPPGAAVAFSLCAYPSEDGMKSLSVGLRTSQKGDNDPAFARQTMVNNGFQVEDVAGLGDAAFWTGLQLEAFKGKHVQVVVSVMGFKDAKGRAIAAARKALEKL